MKSKEYEDLDDKHLKLVYWLGSIEKQINQLKESIENKSYESIKEFSKIEWLKDIDEISKETFDKILNETRESIDCLIIFNVLPEIKYKLIDNIMDILKRNLKIIEM